MIPVLFGEADRPLQGMYTPAVAHRQRRGVVLCPPLGQEYMRSYRTYRILTDRLAGAGLDTFRFDYFGTGNSGGEVEDLSIAGAVADTGAAIQEIADLASVRRVTLIGLRLGSLIAWTAAASSRAVDRLVLWDPVVDGHKYVEDHVRGAPHIGSTDDRQVHGFVFTNRLKMELENATIETVDSLPRKILLIVSEDLPEHRALHRRVGARRAEVEFEFLPNEPSWNELGDLGVGAVPSDILDRIARC